MEEWASSNLQIKVMYDLMVLLDQYITFCACCTPEILLPMSVTRDSTMIVWDVNKYCNTLLVSLVTFPNISFGRKGKTDVFCSLGRKWRVTGKIKARQHEGCNQKRREHLEVCISPGKAGWNSFPSVF